MRVNLYSFLPLRGPFARLLVPPEGHALRGEYDETGLDLILGSGPAHFRREDHVRLPPREIFYHHRRHNHRDVHVRPNFGGAKIFEKKKKEKINIRKFEAFNSFSSSSSSSQIYVIGNSDKVLPFRGYFFINQTVSPVFEFLYLFNVTAGGFGGSMIAGATSFNLVVIIHGSGKFAALRKRMEALSGADPNSTSIMGDNVIRHQQAIKSIKKKSGSFALQTMILTWIDAAIRRYLFDFFF